MRRRDFGSVIVGALAGLVGWRPKRSEKEKSDLESTIKWIDVNDRLPEMAKFGGKGEVRASSRKVLVTWNGGLVGTACLVRFPSGGKMFMFGYRGPYLPFHGATHWAELPKFPKK